MRPRIHQYILILFAMFATVACDPATPSSPETKHQPHKDVARSESDPSVSPSSAAQELAQYESELLGSSSSLCGGPLGLACSPGHFCRHKPGSCGAGGALGACASIPQLCPNVFKPVCGCDGKTYGNVCFAAAAAVNVLHDGACQQIGCKYDSQCGKGQFCSKASCDDGTGTCEDKPTLCTREYAPVCGCNGKSYPNDCTRRAAGVNKLHDGACKAKCGGILGLVCPKGQVCINEPGTCDVSDNMGQCIVPPVGCPDVWQPVCGCDGVTYGNKCEALAAGVSLASLGECIEPGCDSNLDCGKSEYCARASGDCDGIGKCAPRPQACTLEYNPVCGCDGKTYSNACHAAASGVNVSKSGECGCPPIECPFDQGAIDADGDGCDDICVCMYPLDCLPGTQPVDTNGNGCVDTCEPIACETNDDCGWKGLYCEKDGCDGKGNCADRPEICITLYKPVCGCDGKTYSNECVAAAAGVNVAADGPCCAPILCTDEQHGVDVDGDGCDDECVCAFAIKCAPGFLPHDTNGDGCFDACLPAMCDISEDCPFMGPLPYYCKKDGCEGKGICVVQPQLCLAVWAPVCGCDGKTYGNACEAAAAGINVKHDGECACSGIVCNPPLIGWDTDGDGCDDECICGFAILCAPGFYPVDTNGDGCDDACEPNGCTSNDDCLQAVDYPAFCQKDGCDGVGVCAPLPGACLAVWLPVCGCDGKTYSNECYAHSAAVNVKHDGACECAPILCKLPLIATDSDGDGCDDTCMCGFAILCAPGSMPVDTNGDGCDDACTPVSCQTNADCPQSKGFPQFCNKDGCGDAGVCAPKPEFCLDVWMPVCGCDGKTYSNTCYAHSAGVSVKHDGECGCAQILCKFPLVPVDTDGDGCDDECMCGIAIDCVPGWVPVDTDGDGCDDTCKPGPCNSNSDCGFFNFDPAVGIISGGSYCKKDGCAGEGVCAPKPEACLAVYMPVCGCDGKTYGNSCEAAAAGVNVKAQGKCLCLSFVCPVGKVASDSDGDGCPDTCTCGPQIICPSGAIPADTNGDGCPDTCQAIGCQSNSQCSGTQYCAKNTCTGVGQCAPKPELCPMIYAPVCGCDGKTYGNQCLAAAAGAVVASQGPCSSNPGSTF